MLGYFKPVTSELTIEEKDLYKSIYCKLCKVIGNRYGKISTVFVQHDLAFTLILVSKDLLSEKTRIDKKACTVCGIRKVRIIENEDIENILRTVADICIFTVYTAYLNRKIDGKGNSVKNKLFYIAYRKSFKKSLSNLNMTKLQIKELEDILYCENHNNTQYIRTPEQIIHPMCDYYSDLIINKLDIDRRLKNVPYNMCKIMYYLDSLEDFKKDKEEDKFNILNEVYRSDNQIISLVEKKVFDAINEIKKYIVDIEHKNIVKNVLDISILSKMKTIKLKYKNTS